MCSGSICEFLCELIRLFAEDKIIVVDSKVLMLDVYSEMEAYYVCGIINAPIITEVVDGYADFGTEARSLGTHVYEEYKLPVVGIAKNRLKLCVLEDTEVYRGASLSPLYVTAKGIEQDAAKDMVRRMAGPYRIPDLVKLADKYARDWRC